MTNNHPLSLPVAIVVEGESAVASVPQLLRDSGVRMIQPVKFDGQPVVRNKSVFCEFVQRKIVPVVRAVSLKQVRLVLLIIDLEDRQDCPGMFADFVRQTVVNAMVKKYGYTKSPPIVVICANRKLENWLIADPEGLCSHNYVTRNFSRQVKGNADTKDAIRIINSVYPHGRSYDKFTDAPRLAACVRTMLPEVRRRSHSLDKLLRECGVAPL